MSFDLRLNVDGSRHVLTLLLVTATGFWGRGLSIVRAFARVRKVGLKPLWSKAAFVRTLARMHVEYKANVLLGVFVTSLLGIVEQDEITKYQRSEAVPPAAKAAVRQPSELATTTVIPNPQAAQHLFRLLAPVLKGIAAKSAIAGLAECMECTGGVGYLESEEMQFNIARLFRDVNVIPIWEGTTDMMADDVRRVVFGKTGKEAMEGMEEWVNHVCKGCGGELSEYAARLKSMWHEWRERIGTYSIEEVQLRARRLMEMLGDVVMGGLLLLDANRDGNQVAVDTVKAWFELRPAETANETQTQESSWQEVVARDMRVVFGVDKLDEDPKAKL